MSRSAAVGSPGSSTGATPGRRPGKDLAWALHQAPAPFADAVRATHRRTDGEVARAADRHRVGPFYEVAFGLDTGDRRQVGSGRRGSRGNRRPIGDRTRYRRRVAVARLGSITLECSAPRELASFWAGMLGSEVLGSGDEIAAVRAGDLWITAVRSAEHRPSTWPEEPAHRHLDLAVDDLDVAEAEALRLGATRAAHRTAPEVFRPMLDPAGHPFCLSTAIPG